MQRLFWSGVERGGNAGFSRSFIHLLVSVVVVDWGSLRYITWQWKLTCACW